MKFSSLSVFNQNKKVVISQKVNNRWEMPSDIVQNLVIFATDAERLAYTNPSISSLYYVKETKKWYTYTTEWVENPSGLPQTLSVDTSMKFNIFPDEPSRLNETILKGHYFVYINTTNIDNDSVDVYLSNTQISSFEQGKANQDLPASNFYNSSFVSGYAVNDYFCMINNNTFNNFGTISAIDGNKITVTSLSVNFVKLIKQSLTAGNKGWIQSGSPLDAIDYSNYVVDKSSVGSNILSNNSIAFGQSNKSINLGSFASGRLNVASGKYSVALNRSNQSIGYGTLTNGYNCKAIQNYSHAQGISSHATGAGAHAQGNVTRANGVNSHAQGNGTQANGANSHAQGLNTIASGELSHAQGMESTASAKGAKTYGYSNTASGVYSLAGGKQTSASANMSVALGWGTQATAEAQVVIGKYNEIDNNALFIIGNGNASTRDTIFKVDKQGNTVAKAYKNDVGVFVDGKLYNGTPTSGVYNANYNNGDLHVVTISGDITLTVTNIPLGQALSINIISNSDNSVLFGGEEIISESGNYMLGFINTNGTIKMIGNAVKTK